MQPSYQIFKQAVVWKLRKTIFLGADVTYI